jgi:hypothetical protein
MPFGILLEVDILETVAGKDIEGIVVNDGATALQFVVGGGNLHID